jgi:hypothetical protein
MYRPSRALFLCLPSGDGSGRSRARLQTAAPRARPGGERSLGRAVQLAVAAAQHTKIPQCQTDTDRPWGSRSPTDDSTMCTNRRTSWRTSANRRPSSVNTARAIARRVQCDGLRILIHSRTRSPAGPPNLRMERRRSCFHISSRPRQTSCLSIDYIYRAWASKQGSSKLGHLRLGHFHQDATHARLGLNAHARGIVLFVDFSRTNIQS